MTGVLAGLIGTIGVDNTGPVVPTPTRTTSGSMSNATQTDTVSWGAITDAGSGVASATVIQLYYGSTSGFVAGTSQALGSFGASSTTFAIPTDRRQGDGGETWSVTYYIIATDAAGNSTQGTGSTAAATLRYDNTGPVVPTPTRTTSGSMNADNQVDTVSWTAITDAGSGVTSATIYQLYSGSVSGFVAGTSQALGSFGASNTTFAIPTNRRQGDTGESWSVTYYIIATDAAGNSTQGTGSTAAATLRYDITDPVIPTPTVVATSGTTDTVSWGAITDAGSGVASATVYQFYAGSTTGFVFGTNQVLTTFGADNTTFAIPTNRRNTPTGETWVVTYFITVTDAAGNSLQGPSATNHYTKPLGDYSFQPTGADARNIGNTAWLNQTTADEGMVGFSTTKLYGAWFYGSTAFSDKTRGWKPDSGSIWLQRAGSAQTNRGNSGTFSIQAHTSPTKSGALSYVGTAITSSISGNDGTGQPALNTAQLNGLRDDTVKGFALTGHSTTVAFLRGLTVSTNNNPYGVYSGTVFLTYT